VEVEVEEGGKEICRRARMLEGGWDVKEEEEDDEEEEEEEEGEGFTRCCWLSCCFCCW
jgi:hypothetical protein